MTSLSDQGANIYKLLRDEPSSHKKQQWTITNYVLAIYGAILVYSKDLNEQKTLLIISVIILCVVGVVALCRIHQYLYESRLRIDKVDQAVFSAEEKTKLDIYAYTKPQAFRRGLEFTIGLSLVIIMPALILISHLQTLK